MNTEKAKEWLSAYSEGLEFEENPELMEALAMVETDPELRDWWNSLKKMDTQMEEILHEIPIPDDLEERLLATVHKQSGQGWSRFRPYLWASGIAAALVLGAATFLQMDSHESVIQNLQENISGRSPDSYDHFREGMAFYIRSVYFQLDHLTEDLDSIESWLSESEAPLYEALPEGLLALRPLGCKELQWQGLDVSLVCFHTAEGKIVHLFVLERDGANASQYADIERVAQSHSLETGGWMTDEKVYILVGSDPEVDVEFALG